MSRKCAILLAKTSEGSSHEISDNDVLKIIQKLVKQRKETAEIYKQQNRPELAENELTEAGFMEIYLPKQMTQEELEQVLRQIMEKVGATKPSDMGKVMGVTTVS